MTESEKTLTAKYVKTNLFTVKFITSDNNIRVNNVKIGLHFFFTQKLVKRLDRKAQIDTRAI